MSDFVGDRQCVTHHNACDCREAYFKQLQAENERLKKAVAIYSNFMKSKGYYFRAKELDEALKG